MLDSTASAHSKNTVTAPVVTVTLKPGEELSDKQLRVLALALASSVDVDYNGNPANLFAYIQRHAEATYKFLKTED